MPLYQYACHGCDHTEEVQQRLDERPMTTCPKCEMDLLYRVIGKTSFSLVGSGWAKDGYSNTKPPKGNQ